MVTSNEIELLAHILSRAGVTQIEAMWLNDVLTRLRAQAESPKTDFEKVAGS